VASNVTFNSTGIGDKGRILGTDTSRGVPRLSNTEEKKETDVPGFLTHIDTLAKTTLKIDNVQVVEIPRATGVRLYGDGEYANLIVDGFDYGKVYAESMRITDGPYANGYGVLEIVFVGNLQE